MKQLFLKKVLKVFFSFVNTKLHVKESVPALKKSDNSLVVEDLEKCNLLNDFFSSVFTRDNGYIPPFPRRDALRPNDKLMNVGFDILTVRNALKALPSKISSTPDGLPSLFFKKLCDSLCLPLSKIFEISFRTQEFPSVWLCADVVPAFK